MLKACKILQELSISFISIEVTLTIPLQKVI